MKLPWVSRKDFDEVEQDASAWQENADYWEQAFTDLIADCFELLGGSLADADELRIIVCRHAQKIRAGS